MKDGVPENTDQVRTLSPACGLERAGPTSFLPQSLQENQKGLDCMLEPSFVGTQFSHATVQERRLATNRLEDSMPPFSSTNVNPVSVNFLSDPRETQAFRPIRLLS